MRRNRIIIFCLFCVLCLSAKAQETLKITNFEIGHISAPTMAILRTDMPLMNNFDLPDGRFLNIDRKRPEVNVSSFIVRVEDQQAPKVMELNFNLPQQEKHTFEFKSRINEYDPLDPFARDHSNRSFFSGNSGNPTFRQNYSNSYFGSYYVPFRPIYYY